MTSRIKDTKIFEIFELPPIYTFELIKYVLYIFIFIFIYNNYRSLMDYQGRNTQL